MASLQNPHASCGPVLCKACCRRTLGQRGRAPCRLSASNPITHTRTRTRTHFRSPATQVQLGAAPACKELRTSRNSGSALWILVRMVRAPYSRLSLAFHTGTTLWASTSWKGTPPSFFDTCRHDLAQEVMKTKACIHDLAWELILMKGQAKGHAAGSIRVYTVLHRAPENKRSRCNHGQRHCCQFIMHGPRACHER